MKNKVTPRDISIYTLCITGILMLILDSTFRFFELKYSFLIMAVVIIGIMLYYYLVQRVKYAWISLVLVFLLPKPLAIIKFFKYIISGFGSFLASAMENQYIANEYGKYFNSLVYLALPLLILLIYFIIVVHKKSEVFLILGGAVFAIYYFLGGTNLIRNCSIFLIFGFILYSYSNFASIWSKLDTKNTTIKNSYYFRVVVINLVLALFVSFVIKALPIDREPFSLKWFENNIFSRLDETFHKEDDELSEESHSAKFDFSSTGYQQDARRLGGPVRDNNSLAIKVSSNDDIGGTHLRGTIKDSYNGFTWDKKNEKLVKFKEDLTYKEYTMGYTIKEMKIYHDGIRTSTAFNAMYPINIKNNYKYAFIDELLETYHPKELKQGKSYTLKYKEYHLDQEVILERTPKVTTSLSPDFDRYLEVPKEIPQRVIDLAKEITKKYDSPYLRASAIEEYLKTNYPYSKETSILPEGQDFVDYFLFEEKKGSCSYYATALAMMARVVKVPTRYVEGFVVPYTKDSNGVSKILNSDAHAWVELYFDGVGWVTFDPTPGNESLAYDFKEKDDKDSTTTSNTTPQNDNTNKDNKDKDKKDVDPNELEGDAGTADNKVSWIVISLFVLAGLLGLSIVLLLVSIVFYIIVNLRLDKNKRVIDFSKNKMISYGKVILSPYVEGETIREYLEIIQKKLEIDLGSYIELYEKSMYSKNGLTEEELNIVLKTLKNIEDKVKRYAGKFKFHLKDYQSTISFYIRKR